MPAVDAIKLLKKLREEKKKKKKEKKNLKEKDTKEEEEGTVAASIADSNNNNELWENESLFERIVKIEIPPTSSIAGNINSTSSSSININLLEDLIGHLAGRNGATLWDCSIALTNVLVKRYYSNDNNNDNKYSNDPTTRLNVLELGAGLGLVGIAMAATMGANVVVTERSIAIPLLQRNVEHNKQIIDGGGGNVTVSELSWGNEDQLEAICKQQMLWSIRNSMGISNASDMALVLRPIFDVVVMSDLIFPSNSNSYSLLIDTLHSLLFDTNKDKDMKIVEMWLSHEPRRPDVEATFWSMLKEKGINAHRVVNMASSSNLLLPDSHPDDIHIYLLSIKSTSSSTTSISMSTTRCNCHRQHCQQCQRQLRQLRQQFM